MRSVPPAEIDIDEALVRRLLEEQHRDLAGEPLEPAASGWDNAMFRLGDALAVRLPRRASAVPFLEREQRWLPRLAPSLPLPVPSAVRLGRSGSGYPWPWSVVRWLAGNPAEREALAADQAAALAAFLRALHRPAPADAPENPFRGVPLATRAPALDERWQRVARETELVTRAIRRAWSAALEAPLDSAPTWIHGDLHPGNVLVRDGALAGVLDWGDMARGDRATDLAAPWMLLESADARLECLRELDALGGATLARARGWAVYFGSVFLDAGLAGEPRYVALGAAILQRVCEGP